MTKLLDERPPDEAGRARDQYLHRRRVYSRALALLAGLAFFAGCDDDGGKRRQAPPPPPPRQSFLAIDREHQRLVRHYLPVSRALTAYELGFRDWRLGRVPRDTFLRRASHYRSVVARARALVRGDPATGETARGKRLLLDALASRETALRALPQLARYERAWNRSLSRARAGLTVLQDIRDRARLIPLPEDAVS